MFESWRAFFEESSLACKMTCLLVFSQALLYPTIARDMELILRLGKYIVGYYLALSSHHRILSYPYPMVLQLTPL